MAAAADGETVEAPPKKKRTRRGSRGGRGRKKAPAAAQAGNGAGDAGAAELQPKIHLPDPELGAPADAVAEDNGAGAEPKVEAADGDPQPKKKRTRRGSRGGRRRRKPAGVSADAPPPETQE